MFLNGDGEAQIFPADGIAPFTEYQGLLPGTDREHRRLGAFDIVVSNPPYAVPSFRRDLKDGPRTFSLYDSLTADSRAIETLFLERAEQLLRDRGVAGIFFPMSIFNNDQAVYRAARRRLLVCFQIVAALELREKTFMATGTTTVLLFLRRRTEQAISDAVGKFRETKREDGKLIEAIPALAEYVDDDEAAELRDHEVWDTSESEELVAAVSDDESLARALFVAMTSEDEQVVMAFSGDSGRAQESYLGYRLPKRRGQEGLTLIEADGTWENLLFDPADYNNADRLAYHVRRAFEGHYQAIAPAPLREHLKWIPATELLARRFCCCAHRLASSSRPIRRLRTGTSFTTFPATSRPSDSSLMRGKLPSYRG